jgi:hypothetical protein
LIPQNWEVLRNLKAFTAALQAFHLKGNG